MSETIIIIILSVLLFAAIVANFLYSIKLDAFKRVIAVCQWTLEHMGAEEFGGGPARTLKICWVHLQDHPFEFIPQWERDILLDNDMYPAIQYNEQQLRHELKLEKFRNQKLTNMIEAMKTQIADLSKNDSVISQ